MFLGGTVQAIAAMLVWALELTARVSGAGIAPAWPLPPSWWHGLLMIYGVFPFFVFGFILTAGPRWQGAPDTPRGVFVPAFSCLAAGWVLVYLGVFLPALVAVGLALVLAGWLIALRWLWQVALRPGSDRLHIRLVVVSLSLGATGLAALAAFAAGAAPGMATLGIALGLWGFLVTIFTTVTHRMLPFFSSSSLPNYAAYRDDRALIVLWVAALVHGALAWLDLAQWTWLVDLPAAAVALHLTWRWNLRRSLAVGLLAVLHIAFAWFGAAWLLYGVHSLLLLAGGGGLGLAPLHALTIGYFAAMVIGMASRVTLGHSGRPVAADGAMWGAFWTLQAVVLLRIAGEWWPGGFSLAAALLWLFAFTVWYWRYAPNFWRPRTDGRSG